MASDLPEVTGSGLRILLHRLCSPDLAQTGLPPVLVTEPSPQGSGLWGCRQAESVADRLFFKASRIYRDGIWQLPRCWQKVSDAVGTYFVMFTSAETSVSVVPFSGDRNFSSNPICKASVCMSWMKASRFTFGTAQDYQIFQSAVLSFHMLSWGKGRRNMRRSLFFNEWFKNWCHREKWASTSTLCEVVWRYSCNFLFRDPLFRNWRLVTCFRNINTVETIEFVDYLNLVDFISWC